MKPKRRLLLFSSAAAFILAGLVLWLCRRNEQLYKATVLPTLGGTYARPMAINDCGQVAGLADVAGAISHLFIWDREDGTKELGPMDIENIDLNNAGQIAGTLTDPNGNKQAFFWDPNDGILLLGTVDGGESIATALNNRGQVVGFSYGIKTPPEDLTRDEANGGQSVDMAISNGGQGIAFSYGIKTPPQAFIWDKTNGMRVLTPDERQYGMATAINDAGHVLGVVATEITSNPNWMSCYWHSTNPPATLETSPDGYQGGSGINNNGYVLQTRRSRDTRQWREDWVRLWHKDAEIKWLFQHEGYIRYLAFNDANQVLYYHPNRSRYARLQWKLRYLPSPSYPPLVYCLWDSQRARVVLHDQVPREIGVLLTAWDINNRGCIVGSARLKDSGQLAAVFARTHTRALGEVTSLTFLRPSCSRGIPVGLNRVCTGGFRARRPGRRPRIVRFCRCFGHQPAPALRRLSEQHRD